MARREKGVDAESLPVSAYFSNEIYRLEKRMIFDVMPHYFGHEGMIPEVGDYLSVKGEADGRVLIRTKNGVKLISNSCHHRQAMLLQGSGNVAAITCSLHGWTYDLDGRLIGAPYFESLPCDKLESFPLQSWNGLIYESSWHNIGRALSGIQAEIVDCMDFSNYQLDRVENYTCDFNWKVFVEFYLEDYHVVPFHPGLGNFVQCDDLKWSFDDWYSLQVVGVKNKLTTPGNSEVYKKWQWVIRKYYGESVPDIGAMWLYIYPNVMVEWYPLVLVLSSIFPDGPERCINQVAFYHPSDIMLFDEALAKEVRVGAEAYIETAAEDNLIGLRMQAGRRGLWLRGISEIGPSQHPLEDGVSHFHQIYRSQLGRAIQCDGFE